MYIRWNKRNGYDETEYEGRVNDELRYVVQYGPYIDGGDLSATWSAYEVDGDSRRYVAQRDALHPTFACAEVHYRDALARLTNAVNDEAERRDLDPWLQQFSDGLKIQINGMWMSVETAAKYLDLR